MVTSTQWLSYERYLYEHSISYRYASNRMNIVSARYLKYRKKNKLKWLRYFIQYKIVYYFYHKKYKKHYYKYLSKYYWSHFHTDY